MAGEKIVYSPVTLWRGFDALSPSFDTETVVEFENDGIELSYIYFNGVAYHDGVSRVYGVFARRKGKKNLPAIVLLGHIGEPISEREAVFWAKKGYAVLAFDNMGETENGGKHTVYPESASYANYAKSGRHLTNCDTNAKETCWYHWAANTRRAVSFVAAQDCVDTSSIGLVASGGAAVTAGMAAAFDDRLSACAVLFGVCYQDIEIVEGQTAEQIEKAEERERWFAGIAPQSYLMHMHTPFFLCIAANSAKTDLDKTYDALGLIPKETPWALWISDKLPGSSGDVFVRNLDKWLTLRLKKQIDNALLPVVDFRVLRGRLNLIVRVPDEEEAQDVNIYFAREAAENSVRNWNKINLENIADGIYRAVVDVYDKKQACYAYCNVRYKGGLVLSGNLMEIGPDKLSAVTESRKTKIIYNGQMGLGSFQVYRPAAGGETSFYDEDKLEVKQGPDEIRGICGKSFATFALNDSKYLKNDDGILAFDVYSKDPQELTVSVVVDYGDGQKIYGVTEKLIGGELWQKVCVSLAELKGERGRVPGSWSLCEVLCFEAEREVIINNVILN